MNCPACGHAVGDGARFCGGCGASLSVACPSCGGENPPDNRFCQKCGTAIGPGHPTPDKGGERKQVTVLFADAVGYTALSERLDPETVREIMDGCFEILVVEIERYGGTVNTFTGDGCMALFGAPVEHEDHATRAVHAAWAIQGAMAGYDATVQQRWRSRFQLRLGLDTGLVVVGAVSGFSMDFTAMGDTVNLAARLCSAGPPGGTWAGAETWRTTGAAFTWQPVGPMSLKGKAEPVQVFELTGVGTAQGRFEVAAQRGLTQFVGRDAEVAQLLAAWEQARAGKGQIVSVVGEAGLGKSRLLHEFTTDLAKQDVPIHQGSCFSYGEITPYLPFLELLRSVFGLGPTTAPGEAVAAVDARLAELRFLPEPGFFVHQLLGRSPHDGFLGSLSPQTTRQRTVDALSALVVALASASPLALILEDVHWIDAASQEVLAAVVEVMADIPLLVVLAYRPEYLHSWGEVAYHAEISVGRLEHAASAAMVRAILAKPYSDRLALARFSPEQSERMLSHLLGTDTVPEELTDLVGTRTGGNPLFMEELVRSLLERGDLARSGDGYVLTQPYEGLSIPASLHGVLIERVDRLNPGLKTLLQVASVLGRVFSYRLLVAVADSDSTLDSKLGELEDLDFVYPTSLAPEREYSFKHVLVAEAVYDTLLRARKGAYHARAGAALEALYPDRLEEHYELIAHHYRRSPEHEKALEYLALSNQKAMRASAMVEAKTHFEEAMAVLDAMPDTPANRTTRISLLVGQIVVYWACLLPGEHLALLRQHEAVARELDDPALLGWFDGAVANTQWILGDYRTSIETLERSARASEVSGNIVGAGFAYVLNEYNHMVLGNYDVVVDWHAKALKAFDEVFDLHFYMFARGALALASMHRGRWDQALAEVAEPARRVLDRQDDIGIFFCSWALALIHAHRGNSALALEHAERSLDKARNPGDRCFAQTGLGIALCRADGPERAIGILADVGSRLVTGHMYVHLMNESFLAEAYWRTGRLDEARRTLEALHERATALGARYHVGSAERLLGEVTGDPAHFESAIAALTKIGAENELALAIAGYGRWCGRHHRPDEARRHLTGALEIFERLGTLREPDRTREALRSFRG